MKTKLLALPLALSVVAVGQTSAQTVTAVPAAVTTAAGTVATACTQVRSDELQYRIQVALGDATAATAAQATLDTDRSALHTAQQTLHTAVQADLATDEAALKTAHDQLEADFVQLKADVGAGNSGSLAADQTKIATDASAVQTAHTQLEADHLALANAGALPRCGGGPGDFGGHDEHHGGHGGR
jgi:hypothetical protein